MKPDLVNYYSHLLVLRYALNAVHAFYIRPDGLDVKKKKNNFCKNNLHAPCQPVAPDCSVVHWLLFLLPRTRTEVTLPVEIHAASGNQRSLKTNNENEVFLARTRRGFSVNNEGKTDPHIIINETTLLRYLLCVPDPGPSNCLPVRYSSTICQARNEICPQATHAA